MYSGTASQHVILTSVAKKRLEYFAGMDSSKSDNGAHSRKLLMSSSTIFIAHAIAAATTTAEQLYRVCDRGVGGRKCCVDDGMEMEWNCWCAFFIFICYSVLTLRR